MRSVRFTLFLTAMGSVAALLALNWQSHRETHRKLDELAALFAARPGEPAAAATPAAPAPTEPARPGAVPRELSHVTLPAYVIEAPDILSIEAVLRDPKTNKTERLPTQQVSGQHLVRPDGTVSLGTWGSVYVSGVTTAQAAAAIRTHLAKFDTPEMPADRLQVTVDVHAYNSRFYYVVTDAAGGGHEVGRLPLTGNETVLDAVASVGGLAGVAGKRSIRLVRPSPHGGGDKILPVDWAGITERGVTETNYPLLPSDRLYVTLRD